MGCGLTFYKLLRAGCVLMRGGMGQSADQVTAGRAAGNIYCADWLRATLLWGGTGCRLNCNV